jgi:hypothetical protein
VSHTNPATGASTVPPHAPSHLSLIPIEVLHGFIDLLSHPHARDTIIGTSAVNALLMAELVEQVTCIAHWHKRTGIFFLGPETAEAPPSTVPPGPISATPAPGQAPAVAAAAPVAGSSAAAGPAHTVLTHSVSGAAPGTLTPFQAVISSVVANQLALRDTLIAGLRTDLTTAQSALANLKTEHATTMSQLGGLQNQVNGQIDLTTKQAATMMSQIGDLQAKHAAMTSQIGGLQTQVNGQVDLTTKQTATLAQATHDITGLQSVQGDLTHQTSTLHNDLASVRGQLEPLTGRVEQMAFDLARHHEMILEVARDAAAAATPTEVVIVEERNAEPEDAPEDLPPRGRPGRRG